MTGHKGNSEICFPETLSVSSGEAEGCIKVEGKQNSLFAAGPVIKCFVIPPNSKVEKKNCEEIACFFCRSLKKHDLIMCESKVHVVVSCRCCCNPNPNPKGISNLVPRVSRLTTPWSDEGAVRLGNPGNEVGELTSFIRPEGG